MWSFEGQDYIFFSYSFFNKLFCNIKISTIMLNPDFSIGHDIKDANVTNIADRGGSKIQCSGFIIL